MSVFVVLYFFLSYTSFDHIPFYAFIMVIGIYFIFPHAIFPMCTGHLYPFLHRFISRHLPSLELTITLKSLSRSVSYRACRHYRAHHHDINFSSLSRLLLRYQAHHLYHAFHHVLILFIKLTIIIFPLRSPSLHLHYHVYYDVITLIIFTSQSFHAHNYHAHHHSTLTIARRHFFSSTLKSPSVHCNNYCALSYEFLTRCIGT